MSAEKMRVYLYCCVEIDTETSQACIHSGMVPARDRLEVREGIERSFANPQHISVTEVPELVPAFDGNGDHVGFAFSSEDGAQLVDEQPVHKSVDKSEGGEDETH